MDDDEGSIDSESGSREELALKPGRWRRYQEECACPCEDADCRQANHVDKAEKRQIQARIDKGGFVPGFPDANESRIQGYLWPSRNHQVPIIQKRMVARRKEMEARRRRAVFARVGGVEAFGGEKNSEDDEVDFCACGTSVLGTCGCIPWHIKDVKKSRKKIPKENKYWSMNQSRYGGQPVDVMGKAGRDHLGLVRTPKTDPRRGVKGFQGRSVSRRSHGSSASRGGSASSRDDRKSSNKSGNAKNSSGTKKGDGAGNPKSEARTTFVSPSGPFVVVESPNRNSNNKSLRRLRREARGPGRGTNESESTTTSSDSSDDNSEIGNANWNRGKVKLRGKIGKAYGKPTKAGKKGKGRNMGAVAKQGKDSDKIESILAKNVNAEKKKGKMKEAKMKTAQDVDDESVDEDPGWPNMDEDHANPLSVLDGSRAVHAEYNEDNWPPGKSRKNFGPWRPSCCSCRVLLDNMRDQNAEPHNVLFRKLLDPSCIKGTCDISKI